MAGIQSVFGYEFQKDKFVKNADFYIVMNGYPVSVEQMRGILMNGKDKMGDKMYKKNLLAEMKIFEGVERKTIDYLWKVGKVCEYSKKTILIRGKESVPYIYIQISGKSIMYNLTHLGKRKILFIFGADTLLNEHICNQHITSVYCETLEKSKIFVIPVLEFVKQMQVDFKLTENVLEAQERKMWRLSHQLKNTMSSIFLERKLASKLWKLSRDFGVETEDGIEIDINMTITFLADMLGVSRETTSRVCSTLIEQGLIKINKKRIRIADSEKLKQFYKFGKIE